MWLKVVAIVVEVLAKIGLKKKAEADASKADALEKTVESVGESLDVEKDVRDKQKDVDKDPSEVETVDGSLNFDEFNKDKPEEDEPEGTQGCRRQFQQAD
jgi:hypothetical protein